MTIATLSHATYLRLWERTKAQRLPGLRGQFGPDAEDVLQEAFLSRVAGLWVRIEWESESHCLGILSRAVTFAAMDFRRRQGRDERLVHQAPTLVSLTEADGVVDRMTDLSEALCNREELLAKLQAVVLEDRIFIVAEVVGADSGLVELMTGASPSDQRRKAREAMGRLRETAPVAKVAQARRRKAQTK